MNNKKIDIKDIYNGNFNNIDIDLDEIINTNIIIPTVSWNELHAIAHGCGNNDKLINTLYILLLMLDTKRLELDKDSNYYDEFISNYNIIVKEIILSSNKLKENINYSSNLDKIINYCLDNSTNEIKLWCCANATNFNLNESKMNNRMKNIYNTRNTYYKIFNILDTDTKNFIYFIKDAIDNSSINIINTAKYNNGNTYIKIKSILFNDNYKEYAIDKDLVEIFDSKLYLAYELYKRILNDELILKDNIYTDFFHINNYNKYKRIKK